MPTPATTKNKESFNGLQGSRRLDDKGLRLKVNATDAPGFTKPATVMLIFAVALFVTARLWHLTAFSLWFDEIFSLQTARRNWGSLLAVAVDDIVHPPLFYLLLKVWLEICGGVFAVAQAVSCTDCYRHASSFLSSVPGVATPGGRDKFGASAHGG